MDRRLSQVSVKRIAKSAKFKRKVKNVLSFKFQFCVFRFAFCALFILFFISGCATVYNSATRRQEYRFITTSEEVKIGSDIARQIEARFKVVNDPIRQGRLNYIGQRLSVVCDRQDLIHTFKIVDEKSINAFTILGGHIYVHSGLLDFIKSDSELASVLAHELGHSAARHSAKRLETGMGYQILAGLVFHDSKYADLARAVDISVDLIIRGYSRQDELLADRLGVKYLIKSGYSPQASIDVLRRLQEKDGSGPQGIGIFLSDHPLMPERIKTVAQEIERLKTEDF